jgi:single-stranded-DNA-specific exonuclease
VTESALPVAAQSATASPAPPPLRLVSETEAPERPARPLPRLEIPPYDLAAAQALASELGASHVLAQILVRRGFATPVAARAFLAASEQHAPDRFAGIEQAVAVIRRHIAAGTRITVHGDYDVDGVCATALTVRALRSLGANVGWFLPSRLDDGYGLAAHTIERLASRGTGLLIAVDCGITAIKEVELARAAGLEVVIADHHAPSARGELPRCPIVHPAVCAYPCAELCGTGVAFKLAQALGADTAEEDVELVALATVADLMPLRGENRRLVRQGLAALANTSKPGLRALLEVACTDPSSLDAHALGFRLAPRLNAAGRLRRADAALELVLTTDPSRARELAAELDALNAERRAVEERITWEAEAEVARQGPRSAYVLAGEGWHPGVIGIVASRMVERYHRPSILVALDGDTSAHGSGRSIPGFDLLGALHAAADQLDRYGGHRMAAGLTTTPERIPALATALEEHARAVLSEDLLTPVERVDAVASAAELGLGLAEELATLEPHGLGNPRPSLLIPGARLDAPCVIGDGRHVRFSAVSGGARARAVAFGCGGRLPGRPGEALDATFNLERNEWRGVVEPRLVLRHARPCAPAAIEVLAEPEIYLEGVMAELDAPLEPPSFEGGARSMLDRRGDSPLVVLHDALATGQSVLAVCADVPRRLDGLRTRAGGFALVSHHGLSRAPQLADGAAHVVVLDPPPGEAAATLVRAGQGYTHLAWGDAELRFARQMHELEYGLRASLAALYRALKIRGRVAGEELERLLRGEGRHGRPARVAGRLVRVLSELALASLDRGLPALGLVGETATALERSPAYRAYSQRYEDGLRFLSGEHLLPSG